MMKFYYNRDLALIETFNLYTKEATRASFKLDCFHLARMSVESKQKSYVCFHSPITQKSDSTAITGEILRMFMILGKV